MIINAVQTGFLKDIPQQPESLSSLFKEVTKKNNNIYCQSVATEMSKSLHEKYIDILVSQEHWLRSTFPAHRKLRMEQDWKLEATPCYSVSVQEGKK